MAKKKLKADEEIKALLADMKSAGMTADQAERFVSAGYVPLKGMMKFHAYAREADKPNGPEWIALGGKRGPGKSHAAMAQVLDDMLRMPELKVLFIRKIQKAARESLSDIIRRVYRFTTHTATEDGVKLPNGSKVMIGGYKDEKDIDKYLGLEYDVIVVEEATQISETKKDKLRGSLRSSKAWRPRIYLTTNADGIGLLWFKRMFVEPFRAGKESYTRFIDVTGIHNPFINKEYEQWLDSLTGPLAKAWRDGDWDAFAGMAFPQWDRTRHVIQPFEVPLSWVKWRATDWGQASPYCTLWLTKDTDTGRVFVYREHYGPGFTDQQQARAILEMTPLTENIHIHYADPSLWEKKNRHGEVFSTADEYAEQGVRLTRGDNDRISGKRKVNNILADLPDGDPGLQIFDTCPHLIEQLSTLASDETNPEDVDTDQEDHAYDTLRYGLTNQRKLLPPPPPKRVVHPMERVKGI